MEGCPLQENNSVATMRMNLLASSRDDPRVLFVVNDDKILVYRFSTLTPSALPTLVDRISDPRSTDEEESLDRTINAMQVGYLGSEEVLVTANDAGEVCVWFTSNLRRTPILLSVTESAWGIAIHTERRLIAISTNAHTVTVFHCGTNSRISPQHYPSQPASMPLTATEDPTTSQQILSGHGHNIPCVTFSPCGHFIATASVDRTCRTWRLSDGQQIQQKALGPLWGWGVRFVPKESWMTITRAEYRRIPKDHLRPGKHPGLSVRDSPFSTTFFSQRRPPPGRDLRMIRTRWYAGPIHEDRARRRGHGEGEPSRNRTTGQDAQENEETDDRDAALFGLDDDEDEWEDTSSSDAGEMDGQDEQSDASQQRQPLARGATSRQNAGSGSSTNQSPMTNFLPRIPRLASIEVSVDTGDDGDNEGTGMDTEDAAGTAGESSSSASRTVRERKLERRSLLSMKSLESQHSRDQGESSSEQEQTPRVVTETPSEIPPEPIHVEPPEPEEEFQPVTTSTFRNKGAFANLVDVTPFQKVKTPTLSTAATPPELSTTPPEAPTELLLCATARNIYLLGRHPLASDAGREQDLTSSAMPYSTEVTSITLLDDADEDVDDEMALTEDAATGGGWYEEEVSDDSGTDHHHHGHDDTDDSNDSDESGESGSDDGTGAHSHHDPGGPDHVSSVASLHTLTVARSAATRADGRRFHHLEHFDRLIVMELVPELSILIAASQKGTITIFRLLRILDDTATTATSPSPGAQVPSDPSSPAAASASQDAIIHHRDKRHKGKENQDKNKDRPRHKDKNKHKIVTIKGINFVLFPEMYLPRLEPPPLPLYGVSVVPLQPSKPSASRKGNTSTGAPTPTSTPASTPTSFILHLMYMDSQLFTYELRLRNDRDDPVRLSNIFV
ncbi:hypothetical protein BGZ96_007344 [Linnemannia gamsii]|uniref:WD40 repeat-like protein n=1 Tax=Linnemannia gamsii TaxID=64522 RepID=A0ABQ7K2X9_9FUNG|nr:hypothetical protein BGZ96_007344 [Linnemannia gamsii]